MPVTLRAASSSSMQTLFGSQLPFVLFDTGTGLTIPMDEGKQRIHPHGLLGQYLHDIRVREKAWQSPNKGVFDLGDIAALVDPSLAQFEVVDAPSVGHDMLYDHKNTRGRMVRIHSIDRARTFDLLERKLKEANK